MHKPNITLACVVHCKGKFLFVEEFEYGKYTLNQPAGHLEKDESLLEAAQRELFEETGLTAPISSLIKIYQWHAPLSQTDYLRFVFAVEVDDCCDLMPQDTDITRALWLTLAEFQDYIHQPGQGERSPLVTQSLQDYLNSQFYPINLLQLIQ